MRAFVTGATGFIGKKLSERLVQEGHEVVCAGRALHKLASLTGKIEPIYLDIEDPDKVREIIRQQRPDILLHCAALVDSKCMNKLLRANAEGSRNVFDACLNEGIEKVVYLSSIAVVSGNPEVPITDDMPYKATNPYGESKVAAEKIALEYREKGLKIAILRPPIVYGEDESHGLKVLINLIRWRLLPILGKGTNRLHLVDIENVVDVMILALSEERLYEGSYIVADKEILSIRELLDYIAKITGTRGPIQIPERFVCLFTHLPLVGKRVRFFRKDRIYSTKRLQERLGYTPRISVYEGLKRAVMSLL